MGLLVKGWDGIQTVLEEYARMDIPIDGATVGPEMIDQPNDRRKYGKNGSDNPYQLPEPYSSEEFVPRVLKELQDEQLGTRVWFGYTGNTFQKTNITVEVPHNTNDDSFILKIDHFVPGHSKYGQGNYIEEELARRLGLEHVLRNRSISVAQPNDGQVLVVDMENLAKKLTNLNMRGVTAGQLVSHFLKRGYYGEPTFDGYMLGNENGLRANFNFQGVGEHYDGNDRNKAELWAVDGENLIIPLTNIPRYQDQSPAGFYMYISPQDYQPILSEDQKQSLASITGRVVQQFGVR